MNKSMLTGIIAGAVAATAIGGVAGYRALNPQPEFAEVMAVEPVTEVRKTPKEVCEDVVVSEQAPSDILTGNSRKAAPQAPAGLAASRLSGQQLEMLMRLVGEYAATMPTPVAESRLAAVRKGGTAAIHFAWAGSAAVGEGHYYRVQGPGLEE